MSTCRCGATWVGKRIEHCASCHETFTGTSAGDKHRVGDHAISVGPNRRRCLTVAEMAKKGLWRTSRGYWAAGRPFTPERRDGAFAGAPNRGPVDPTTRDGVSEAHSAEGTRQDEGAA